MDTLIQSLFNDGNNDGKFIIKTKDDVEIKCHHIVLKKQSDYFKSLDDFETNKLKQLLDDTKKDFNKINNTKTTHLDYSSKVVKTLLNKMYNSNYIIKDLTYEEIIEIVKLIDEILIQHNKQLLEKELVEILKTSINEKNWLHLLQKAYDNNLSDLYINSIQSYFLNEILIKDDIVENDPLKNIDLNSFVGKILVKLMRRKIHHHKLLIKKQNLINKLHKVKS